MSQYSSVFYYILTCHLTVIYPLQLLLLTLLSVVLGRHLKLLRTTFIRRSVHLKLSLTSDNLPHDIWVLKIPRKGVVHRVMYVSIKANYIRTRSHLI